MPIARRASKQQKPLARKAASKQASCVGQYARLIMNQGSRECTVLAQREDVLLVEYVMPSGVTALAFAQAPLPHETTWNPLLSRLPKRPCSYRTLTKTWLSAVCAQRGTWKGISHAGLVGTPKAVFAERFPAHRTQRVTQGWQKVSGPPLPDGVLQRRKVVNERTCVIEQVASQPTAAPMRWIFKLTIDGTVMHRLTSRYANAWASLASLAHRRQSKHMPGSAVATAKAAKATAS